MCREPEPRRSPRGPYPGLAVGRWIVKFAFGEFRRSADTFNGVPLTRWSATVVADALSGIGATDVQVVLIP